MEEQQNSFKDTFLAAVLDQMDTNFYITDVETDEILYMNKTMKETFGLTRPEGRVCWQVLQKDMKDGALTVKSGRWNRWGTIKSVSGARPIL